MDHIDMVYNTTDGKTMAGGYSVNSILLNEQQPAIYSGGKAKDKIDKVSERFKHLAVPAGLLYINYSTNNTLIQDQPETSVINDELYEKLLALAQPHIEKDKKYTRSKNTKGKHKMKKTKRNNKK